MKFYIYKILKLTLPLPFPLPHNMDYHNEFRLVSSKYVFRLDEITPEEIKLWSDHLVRDGFNVNDPREIFEPFCDEEYEFQNTDIATQELRVRRWMWRKGGKVGGEKEGEGGKVGGEREEHELIDINAWPGDNESGVITIDGVPCIENGDSDLEFIDDYDNPGFELRLPFFKALRTSIYPEEDNINFDIPGLEAFRNSEHGHQAIKIDAKARALYTSRIEAIKKEHKRLRDLYLPEFMFMYSQFDGTYYNSVTRSVMISAMNVAERIGYRPRMDCWGNLPDVIRYKFFRWTYQGKYYTLVSVDGNNEYLLNDQGKIDYHVFERSRLVKGTKEIDGKRTDIILALHSRIHAFIEIRNGSY